MRATRIRLRFAVIVCVSITICVIGTSMCESFSQLEEDLKGESFRPKWLQRARKEFGPKTPHKRFGPWLANWDIIYNWPKVHKIRVVGFRKYNHSQRLDWSTTDPLILETVRQALSAGGMRRLAVSDLSLSSSGFLCGNADVIVVELEKKRLIIGASQVGFYFGISMGSSHQAFDSWLLAKQLDDIIHAQTGQHLDEATFQWMSGERNLLEQKKVYSELRAKKKSGGGKEDGAQK